MAGRKRIEELYPTITEHLGTMPDKHVALMFNCSSASVGILRRRLGVAAYSGPRNRPQPERGSGIESGPPVATPMEKDQGAVIVLFRASGDVDDLTVSMLNSYDGVRVFDRENIDYRVTMGGDLPPYFASYHDAVSYLLERPGKHRPCRLKFTEAVRFFSGPWADFRSSEVRYA
jgi:hypothetical protein